jgi:acetyltransferase-like isoleucine patch superfamily enzyme
MKQIKTVISGSFRKYYQEIKEAIEQFENLGIDVLSPKKSIIINPDNDFALLESDESDNIYYIENKHLSAIIEASFLYVVNPNGYIGLTVAFEMGWAYANNCTIYCMHEPNDILLKEFCNKYNISPDSIDITGHCTTRACT